MNYLWKGTIFEVMIIWVFVTNNENNVLISNYGKQFIFIVSIPKPSP